MGALYKAFRLLRSASARRLRDNMKVRSDSPPANLPWMLDESTLAKDLNLKSVHLMSDLEAVARAVPTCKLRSCSLLIQGEPIAHGTIAIITT
jgi:glucokinase